MFRFFLTLLCIGAVAIAENERDCVRNISEDTIEELKKVKFLPDRELLADVCPELISYMECVEKEELPEDVEDYHLEFFYGLKDVLNEVCEEDSELQTAYLSSVTCFRNESGKTRLCSDIGEDVFKEFQDFKNNTNSDISELVSHSDERCMVGTFTMACTAIEMLFECGEVTHNTYLEIVRRTHLMRIFCQPSEMHHLIEFLDFLKMKNYPVVDVVHSFIEHEM